MKDMADGDLWWAAEQMDGFSGGQPGRQLLFARLVCLSPLSHPQLPRQNPSASAFGRLPTISYLAHLLPLAGRELAKFMASVQAMAYGSHNAELTSAMFRRMVETKVGFRFSICS